MSRKNGSRCDKIMKQRPRKGRCGKSTAPWLFPRRACRRELSIRNGNSFFYYILPRGKCNSNLTLTYILEVFWLFLNTPCIIRKAAVDTQHSTAKIVERWNTCSMVCSAVLDTLSRYVHTRAHPIQIDESCFSGKRKYNRGRLLMEWLRTVYKGAEEGLRWGTYCFDEEEGWTRELLRYLA